MCDLMLAGKLLKIETLKGINHGNIVKGRSAIFFTCFFHICSAC